MPRIVVVHKAHWVSLDHEKCLVDIERTVGGRHSKSTWCWFDSGRCAQSFCNVIDHVADELLVLAFSHDPDHRFCSGLADQ